MHNKRILFFHRGTKLGTKLSTAQQTKDQTPPTITMNKQQRKNPPTQEGQQFKLLEWWGGVGGLKQFYQPNVRLIFCCCQNTHLSICLTRLGPLTYFMYHHREAIKPINITVLKQKGKPSTQRLSEPKKPTIEQRSAKPKPIIRPSVRPNPPPVIE